MVGRAATNITGANQSYFFKGDKYVKINWTPGKNDDTIAYGPTEFVKEWASLKEAGFSRVDAILPIPGHDHRAYFFSGSKYARIEYVPNGAGEKILGGVRTIKEGWQSIDKAGFDHVDGAIMVPGTTDEAYILCGEKYCRIRFEEGSNDDKLVDGPRPITEGWGAMTFKSVDTLLPEPGTTRGTYAFCGDKYARFNIVPGGRDELVAGPYAVAQYWQSLVKAGFY